MTARPPGDHTPAGDHTSPSPPPARLLDDPGPPGHQRGPPGAERAEPADPLERLRAASGLSIDAEGCFRLRGEAITHARTLEVLWGSLSQDPAGRWTVHVGRESGHVEVEETPWVVRGLLLAGDPPAGATLVLCGGREAPLDPAAVWPGADGVLRCRLPDGATARASRAGQVALGELLAEDPPGSGRYQLLLGGRRYPLGVAPPA